MMKNITKNASNDGLIGSEFLTRQENNTISHTCLFFRIPQIEGVEGHHTTQIIMLKKHTLSEEKKMRPSIFTEYKYLKPKGISLWNS